VSFERAPHADPMPTDIDLFPDPPHHPGMDRRRFLLTSLAGVLAAPLGAEAQQPPTKMRRIGMLMPVSAAAAALNIEAFRQGLRELGYIEGQNVAIETR